MPTATFSHVDEILSRYYDHEICKAALRNPDKQVRELSLRHLKDSTAIGDPFAAEILEEFNSQKE